MGNKATANADIKANHYLIGPKTGDEGFWQINGSYRYQLEKGGKGWTITALTLIAGSEQGSREVLGKASELAAKRLEQRNRLRLYYVASSESEEP